MFKRRPPLHMTAVVSATEFASFVANLPARTISHVVVKEGGYEVEWFVPPAPDADLFAITPVIRLNYPPCFSWHLDPVGCERMAWARGTK
jgi:hypothetical protein